MQKLRIASKTTLQKFRDEGRIRFIQPDKKVILYDNDSIKEYLEKHSKSTFEWKKMKSILPEALMPDTCLVSMNPNCSNNFLNPK